MVETKWEPKKQAGQIFPRKAGEKAQNELMRMGRMRGVYSFVRNGSILMNKKK